MIRLLRVYAAPCKTAGSLFVGINQNFRKQLTVPTAENNISACLIILGFKI